MPRVPVLRSERVNENRLGSTRVNFGDQAARSIQGSNQATQQLIRSGQELANTGSQIATQQQQIQQAEKKKADDIAVTEYTTQFSDGLVEFLYNPESGVLNTKKKNAADVVTNYENYFKEQVALIDNDLSNPEQKLAAKTALRGKYQEYNKTVNRHVSKELFAHDKDVTESFLKNSQRSAVEAAHDPELVRNSIDRQTSTIYSHGQRNGLSNETIQLHINEAKSDTHSGVIGRLVDGSSDREAKAYFNAIKDEILPEQRKKIKNLLEEGNLRGQAQRLSDKYFSSAKGDLGDAVAKAKGIRDPKLRDQVIKNIRQDFSIQEQDRKAGEEKRYLHATNLVDAAASKGITDIRKIIPASQYLQLSLSERNALEKRLSSPEGSDEKRYLEFSLLDPEDLNKLSKKEFEEKYWAHFDEGDRNRAISKFTDAKEAKAGKGRSIKDFSNPTNATSFKDKVRLSLVQGGFLESNDKLSKLDDDKSVVFNNFTRKAQSAIERFEIENGRKSTGSEQQKILDGLVIDSKVFRREKTFGLDFLDRDSEISIFEAAPGDTLYVPIDKIPKLEINSIKNRIRSSGNSVTDDKVQRIFGAMKAGNRELVLSILNED